jgi:hypothetical protein
VTDPSSLPLPPLPYSSLPTPGPRWLLAERKQAVVQEQLLIKLREQADQSGKAAQVLRLEKELADARAQVHPHIVCFPLPTWCSKLKAP